ncbi:cytochrome P450 [Herpetosiphon gulosus]|uniref:Cytochrome P450 120 n=1 Tax=Herpetosiphon gulosus TaxID=1973496 RepID=A0ABP9WXH5_9CHLR
MTVQQMLWKSGPTDAPLPPVADGSFLVGSLQAMLSDPIDFFVKQYQKFGPIFRVKALNNKFTILAGPEACLFLAREGTKHFSSWETWHSMDAEMGASKSLISVDGEQHSRLRALQKRGYSRQTIETQFPEVLKVVHGFLDQWQVGTSKSTVTQLQRLITDELGMLIAGQGPGDYIDDVRTFVRIALMTHITRQRPGILRMLPEYRRARDRSLELSKQVLKAHRNGARDTNRPPSLIDDIIAATNDPSLMPEGDLVMTALGPYIAGLDTVANTMAFLLYVLTTKPELYEQVEAEADALFANGVPDPADLRKMEVLHRVVLENFRMYPIAPAVPRTVKAPFEFGGYRVDAGIRTLVATTVGHFLPELHPEPEKFDIDRYLAPRNEHRIPGAFAPFSTGSHTCLGAGLAEVQIMLTTAALLHYAKFEADPIDYKLKKVFAPTPAPDSSFKLRLVARRNS